MQHAAIPTTYNGVNFRSRLEAKWAAFFDEMRWQWAYEPIDLNGWIPDFVVGLPLSTGAFVEIKPIEWFSGIKVGQTLESELRIARMATPMSSRGLIVLGIAPSFDCFAVHLGPVFEPQRHRLISGYLYQREHDGRFDIPVGADNNYPGLMTGEDYKCPENSTIAYRNSEIERAWKRACNAVQWRKPKVFS